MVKHQEAFKISPLENTQAAEEREEFHIRAFSY